MNDEHKYKINDYLIETIQKLSLARTLDDVVAVTRTAARKLTGADGATFVLRDGEFCFYVDEEAVGPLWKGKRFPLSTCISGWSMLNRENAVIEDIYKDSRIPIDAYRPTFVKSLAMVPIRQESPIGAIGNYWATPHKATPYEINLLKALADSTSVALENVQLISNLKEAKLSLEDALQSRDEFLSVASHELRTPLSALKLQLQFLEKQMKVDAFNLSLRQVNNLSNLIENLLDVSRIRLQKLSLDYTKFNFSEVVKKNVEEIAPSLKNAKCTVDITLDEQIEGEWDKTRIGQIVTNLLSNVCKYAPGKPVKITAQQDGVGSVILSVIDKGPGIPQEMHKRIFDRFERGQSYHHVSGLGLGLFITNNLIKAHGGHLRVESEPGHGAKFVVELPLYINKTSK